MDPTQWLPFYPDLLPRAWSRLDPPLASQPPYNVGIFPVPDLLATQTFYPIFPDLTPRRPFLREQTTVPAAAIFSTARAPTSWLPSYPALVPRPQLPVAARPEDAGPPLSVQMVIAQSLAWKARYPAQVPPPIFLQLGGFFYAIPPEVAAAAVTCVDLALDTLDQPGLLAESLTLPDFQGEGLGMPTFLGEDLC